VTARGFVAAVNNFSDAELDELFSPIALYPDPLLAQVVPAATFIDQLEQAQRVLNGSSDDNLISQQDWDVSVKSVAHYPQVLQMMVDKRDWTTAVGQAYVNQSTDVGKSIQRLRAEARAAGSLVTTSQQQVVVEGNTIKIVPAQPQVIYVPQYNPQVVYVEKDDGPSTGDVIAASVISFGVGMAIGAWLNNDWDWYGRGIYYHGWVGGGWVSVNRTFVNVNRNVYVNNRYRNVNVNRNITNRNINNYRTTLNRNATVRQQNIARNRNNINRNNINRNNIRRDNINRNKINHNEAQRTKHDPTVKSIRFVSENPEERFFTTLKDFRFDDGGAFDFRGSKEYSVGGSEETLSDSNQRASKGFVSTLELKGKVTIEMKLDWIFVKPVRLTDPDDTKQPYVMAPQFGRTLKALNYSLKNRISDHNPLIVDLRFQGIR
jgi:hypothetical protein